MGDCADTAGKGVKGDRAKGPSLLSPSPSPPLPSPSVVARSPDVSSGTLDRACRYVVEGRSLDENPDEKLGPLQLVVPAHFRPFCYNEAKVKAVEEQPCKFL